LLHWLLLQLIVAKAQWNNHKIPVQNITNLLHFSGAAAHLTRGHECGPVDGHPRRILKQALELVELMGFEPIAFPMQVGTLSLTGDYAFNGGY